jgi:hypothetical protein
MTHRHSLVSPDSYATNTRHYFLPYFAKAASVSAPSAGAPFVGSARAPALSWIGLPITGYFLPSACGGKKTAVFMLSFGISKRRFAKTGSGQATGTFKSGGNNGRFVFHLMLDLRRDAVDGVDLLVENDLLRVHLHARKNVGEKLNCCFVCSCKPILCQDRLGTKQQLRKALLKKNCHLRAQNRLVPDARLVEHCLQLSKCLGCKDRVEDRKCLFRVGALIRDGGVPLLWHLPLETEARHEQRPMPAGGKMPAGLKLFAFVPSLSGQKKWSRLSRETKTQQLQRFPHASAHRGVSSPSIWIQRPSAVL